MEEPMERRVGVKGALACLAVAALAVGLVACGGPTSGSGGGTTSPKPKDQTTVIDVTAAEQAASQSVHVGDIVDVTLPSNSSTGYQWTFEPDQDGVIEQVGEPTQSSSSDTPGAPGTTVISLKAVKEGGALVVFKEMPPSDKGAPGSVYTMSIEVKPGSEANRVSVNQDYVTHSVMMNVSDTLQVSLADNSASTGYKWKLESVSSSALKSTGAPKIEAGGSEPGSPGAAVFSFQGVAAGQATLVFSQRQPGTNRISGTWAVTAEVLPNAQPVAVVVDNVTAKKGTVTQMMQGDTLSVKVDGRPSDGYGWSMQIAPSGALAQQGDPTFQASSDMIGAGGKLVYKYAVKAAGAITLDAAYHDQNSGSTGPTRQYTWKFESAAQHKPAVVNTSGTKSCPLVSVNKGDKVNLHLHGSSATNYNWVVASIDAKVLKQVGKAVFKKTGGDGTGVTTIPFRSVTPGGTTVVLLHAAQGKAPEATFACSVVVGGMASHKTLDVTVEQPPATVDLKSGDTLQVNIPGNATTGYQWIDASPDNMIMVQDGEPTYKADESGGMVGTGGVYTLKWKAAGPGGELVMAELKPPGDQAGAPESIWSVWVNVTK
jgi:inhibitor of cysteine peptidase